MSELLKMSLAMDDEQLKKRVEAAIIIRANTVANQNSAQGQFGRMIVSEPTSARHYPDFMIRITTDPAVQEQLALAPDNSQVWSTNVTDKQIQDLVNSELARAAEKYAPQPEGEDS